MAETSPPSGLEQLDTGEKHVGAAESGVVARALSVIEAVVFSEEPASLKEIEERTALPKPTAHRMLAQLERIGFVQRTIGPKRYLASGRLASLGLAAVRSRWSYHEAHHMLEELVTKIGETCNLTLLDGYNVLIVDRVETDWPIRFVLQVNSTYPLHCTASGKLYLALMPTERRSWYLKNRPLKARTKNTITDPHKLGKILEKVRRELYAIDNEEMVVGLIAVAVPIFGMNKRIIGTVAVNATSARVGVAEAEKLLPLLRDVADRLGEVNHP